MPPDERVRQGRREPTYLPPEEWAKAGAWLEALWRDRNRSTGLSKRAVLVGIEYEGGTNRLNDYFNGKRPPKPKTLRKLCKTLGASYVEAVARYGYYREFMAFLDSLVWLGEQWLEEDNARGGTLRPDKKPASRLQSLRDLGLIYWKGQPITRDILRDETFLNRYFVGVWNEPEHEVIQVQYAPIEFKPGATVTLALDPSAAVKQEIVVAPASSTPTALPKPIALAIMLAVLVFPRRGDLYEDEAPDYQRRLYLASGAMIEEADDCRSQTRTGRPKLPNPLLRRTLEALDDTTRYFDARRVVAAEHIMAWADQLCNPFTHYARLAAFRHWSEAGSRVSTVTGYGQMPQRRKAELPSIEALTTYS